MKYLNKKMIIVINKLVIKKTGGSFSAPNNLRSGQNLGFVERIYVNNFFGQEIYEDIFHQAGAYMFYIIKNHSFHDGNKRTGLASAISFLEWNYVVFAPLDEDEIFDFVISVTEGASDPESSIANIAHWLKEQSLY